MSAEQLPKAPVDVLSIPVERIPETLRRMMNERQLSPLLARIHADMASDDDAVRMQSVNALRRLGFPD